MNAIRSLIIFACVLLQLGCKDKVTDPPKTDPPPPAPREGCPFVLAEVDDTIRSYISWGGGNYKLNTTYVDVRFAPGVSDSDAIAVADRYGLKPKFRAVFRGIRQYVFCIPSGKRAEQYFTPYGKPDVQNFGTEPMVDAAFAVFENGLFAFSDEFIVQFDSTADYRAIDSINRMFHVIVDTTYVLADQLWHKLRVTKQSPYSSFDMANLYHCLEEIREGISAANIHAFNPPLGEQCIPVGGGNSYRIDGTLIRRE